MSKVINYQDSMYDVVDTVGSTIVSFVHNVIKSEMPSCNYVFDPNLSYETAIKEFRAQNNFEDRDRLALPLFAYKRSNLRYLEDGLAPTKRVNHSRGVLKLDEKRVLTYTPVYAEFTMEFLYINPKSEEIEQFEIAYLSEEGITGTKQFDVELPDLGVFNYFVSWQPDLVDLEIQDEQNNYKAIAGSCTIRGFYFTFRSESSIILDIKQKINSYLDSIQNSELISEINITGEQ